MQPRKFNIVTDAMWGSCGKGAITTALANKHRPEIISTTNMANAGHTAVNKDGKAFVAKALPSASILTKWIPGYQPQIVVGASAAFTIDQLMDEIQQCGVNYTLNIHPRAGVITDEHKAAEAGGTQSTKHIASTMQGCGAFLADKIMRKPDVKLARDYEELKGLLSDHLPKRIQLPTGGTAKLMNRPLHDVLYRLMTQHGHTILHEGSQGFSLDISHGSHYPHCTSRGTTAIQNAADMGIGHNMIGDVYLVIRPYPIRVGSVIEDGKQVGYSGDAYPGQRELTWDQVAKESGMPDDIAASLTKKELTTVTKRLRRVFEFSEQQLYEAAIVNGATKIALNFANYIDWSCFGMNEFGKLPSKVLEFIRKVEDITNLPVTVVGTGPQLDHVCIA